VQELYLQGSLGSQPDIVAYAMRMHVIMCRRCLIAGAFAAIVVLREGSRLSAAATQPSITYLRISPDLQALVFSAERMGALRLSVPLAACCAVLDGSASALYAKTSYTLTLRFTASRAIEDALGPLMHRSSASRHRHHEATSSSAGSSTSTPRTAESTPSSRSRSDASSLQSSSGPHRPAPGCGCTSRHIDMHIPIYSYPAYCMWLVSLRWVVWRYGRIGTQIYSAQSGFGLS
jgi:hypothetical protein